MGSRKGSVRVFKHPKTGKRHEVSIIRDEILVPDCSKPPYDAGSYGKYRFGAWLEEDKDQEGVFYVSFPYWRNGRFAAQTTLRAEPSIVRTIFDEMARRGWFKKKSWSDSEV